MNARIAKISPAGALGIMALGILLVTAVAFAVLLPRERRQVRDNLERSLRALADDRAAALDHIIEHHIALARIIASYPTTVALAAGRVDAPAATHHDAAVHLADLVRDAVEQNENQFAMVVGPGGAAITSVNSAPALEKIVSALNPEVQRANKPVFDLRAVDGGLSLVIGVPVRTRADGPAIAAVFVAPDARHEFFPVLRIAPDAFFDITATLAVPRGPMVELFSPELQPDSAQPASIARPASPGLAGSAAIQGKTAVAPFTDYRGASILAATRKLGTTGWGLVVKADEGAAAGLAFSRVLPQVVIVLLLLTGFGGLGYAWWRSAQGRYEASLSSSRARFSAVLDQANEAIFFVSEDSTILEANHRAYEMYGYRRGELPGMSILSLIAPAQRERVAATREELIRRGGGSYEAECIRKDGATFPVEISSRKTGGPGEESVVLCVVRDTRERLAAEEERRRLTERLQLQVNAMPTACVVVTPDAGLILDWNPAAEKIFGFTRQEAIGRSPFGLIAPESSRAGVAGALAPEMLANGPHARFDTNLTKDGRTILCRWTNVALRDPQGHIVAVMGLGEDVTAFRDSEEQVRILTRAVEQSPASVFITDVQGHLMYVNPAFERITGYSAAEVIGRNPNVIQSGKMSREFYQELWGTIKRGETWKGEFVNRRKNGEFFREDATITPVTDAAGRITHFLAIKEDVTHKKHLEDELRQAQKMEAVGRLAGGVAHDFNNLLTVILGNCEAALADIPDNHPNHQDLLEINGAARRAASLTRQLLAFSRRQIIQPQVLDVNTVIEGVGKIIRRLLGEDITITTTLASELHPVFADPGQLEQVLLNLCVNARDAMPQGGQLTIATQDFEVDAEYEREHPGSTRGPHVRLEITDSGTGMTPDIMRHLFEPFFTTKPQGKGTGLGLSTVYGIVKQSHGFITVRSEPGAGTTFSILLPRTDRMPVAAAGETRPAAARGKETILLAEDDAAVRTIARRVLEGLGYNVLAAADGQTALQMADAHRGSIQLLFTDLVMPGMGGRELARTMRDRHPGIRILVTSGYSETAAAKDGILDSGVAFLPKPFSIQEIATAVRQTLDGKPIAHGDGVLMAAEGGVD